MATTAPSAIGEWACRAGALIIGCSWPSNRDLAEGAGDSAIKEDLFDWAAICDEVANNIDDRRASG
jgi:hypothetical protein